jgi:hypothetical protein
MKAASPAGGGDASNECRIRQEFSREKGKRMTDKKLLALAAIFFMLLLVMATPGPAAEKTIQLNIPGCHV